MSKPTPLVRAGVRTSEFWLAAAIVGAILESGIIAQGTTLDRCLGLVALVLTSLGYGYHRTRAKAPMSVPPRNPETGHIAGRVLFWLACAGLGSLAGLAWGCSSVGKQAAASKAHVVDCTAAAIREHAAAYGARVEAAITAATINGAIDWERVGEAVAELGVEAGLEVAGCAAARTVADMLERPSAAPVDRETIRAGWAHVQRQHLGGRVYEAGAVRAQR